MIRFHWNLTLLQFASPKLAEEIDAQCPLVPLSQRTFHPTSHLIDDQQAESLAQTLVERGYSPRVESASPSASTPRTSPKPQT